MLALIFPTLAYAEASPDSFPNLRDAKQHQCRLAALKSKHPRTCFLLNYDYANQVLISIYDENEKGEFTKSQELCIPSWYGMAKAKAQDLLGTGQDFLLVEFEGNRGSGVLQMVLMGLAWFDGQWQPAFAETHSYYISGPGNQEDLNLTYRFRREKDHPLSLLLDYRYVGKSDGKMPHGEKKTWKDELFWNPQTHSFYDPAKEEEKLKNHPNDLATPIIKARLKFKNVKLKDYCSDFLEKTGIMDVL